MPGPEKMKSKENEKLRSPQREKLITENLGLVRAAAHRFRGRGIDYDDLFQAGCVGLCKAADGFEPERGLRFSTYAVPAILGEIKRQFRDGGSVKVGRALKQLSMNALKIRENYCREHGCEPTVSELAALLGVEPETAADAIQAAAPTISLTVSNEEDEESQLDIPVPFEEEKLTDRISLVKAMKELDEEDRELLRLRYFCLLTQTEAAKRLNMTQVQVSRREKKLLTSLRKILG